MYIFILTKLQKVKEIHKNQKIIENKLNKNS